VIAEGSAGSLTESRKGKSLLLSFSLVDADFNAKRAMLFRVFLSSSGGTVTFQALAPVFP